MKARRIGSIVAVVAAVLCSGAHGDTYPSKPIRIVVAAAAGGPTDMTTRLIADEMSRSMGVPVLTDPRAGGGGTIGSEAVARAPADGYTLLMGSVGTHGANPTLFKKLGYDAIKDFSPIAEVVSYPLVVVVNPSRLPVANMRELVEAARKNPGGLNRGSAGNGTSMHLSGELFNSMADVKMSHIPYKGSAPAMNDLVAGQLDIAFESMAVALPHVQSGRIRALAVTGRKRSPLLPDVPAIAESLPGYEFDAWLGLLAPANTPAPIVTRLHQEVVKALQKPEIRQKLLAQGAEPVGSTPQEFGAFIAREIAKLGKVIRDSGTTVD